MRHAALIACLCLPAAAQAACKGETLLSCPVGGGNELQVCAESGGFTYAFGPPGAPELQLSVPMAAGTVTPWPGVGSAIWSSVGFPNAGFTYEVWISVERNPDGPPPAGGVNVLQGDDIIAQRECSPGTVSTDPFRLSDLMSEAGFCWDFDSRSWRQDGQCG